MRSFSCCEVIRIYANSSSRAGHSKHQAGAHGPIPGSGLKDKVQKVATARLNLNRRLNACPTFAADGGDAVIVIKYVGRIAACVLL